jgi:RHS repeat-associated protein
MNKVRIPLFIGSRTLIHMNGRVYDYNLGRFLSVDPFIQDPGNSQSMNPYSYIMNNPLSGTDPSGYRSICKASSCETIQVNQDAARDNSLFGKMDKALNNGASKGQSASKSLTISIGSDISSIGSAGAVAKGANGDGENQDSTNGRIVSQTDGTVMEPNEENGIVSVDADGVPSFDEEHDDFHFYNVTSSCSKSSSGCSFERIREAGRRYPAPGADGNEVNDEQIGDALVGLVRHEVSADGGTVINVTLPGKKGDYLGRHLLHPGIVRRWITQDKNNVYIHTYGEGTGSFGMLNREFSELLWGSVDNQAFDWAAGKQ